MSSTQHKEVKADKELKQVGIDSYKEFEQAVMNIHANIHDHDDPFLEVTDQLFSALAQGRQSAYLTYGKPGIKVFKTGTMKSILEEENLPADQFRELEISRMKKGPK